MILKLAQVVSVDDELGGDRVQVRLFPEDAYEKSDTKNSITYAFPLLPKMIHIKPKVGEMVLVLNSSDEGNTQRFYVGPVISQVDKMEYDTDANQAMSLLNGSQLSPGTNPYQNISRAYGAFPNRDDINIVGRRGGEIQLKLNEARIKAGVALANQQNRRDIYFNSKCPSYLKLKYHERDDSQKSNILTRNFGGRIGDDGYKSTATMVADKIFLLGNTGRGANGKKDTFNTKYVKLPTSLTSDDGSDDLITDEELNRALTDAHKVPFGDALVEYLKELTEVLRTHTHDYSSLPPNQAFFAQLNPLENKLLKKEEMLSDNIRIN